MTIPNLKALGLGAAIVAATAGSAFAATATANVNVRSGPGTQYHVVDTLRAGEYAKIIARSGGWCEVQKSGPDGWVSCGFLTNGGRVYVQPRASISFSFGPQMPNYYHYNRWDRFDRYGHYDRNGHYDRDGHYYQYGGYSRNGGTYQNGGHYQNDGYQNGGYYQNDGDMNYGVTPGISLGFGFSN